MGKLLGNMGELGAVGGGSLFCRLFMYVNQTHQGKRYTGWGRGAGEQNMNSQDLMK